MGRTRCRPIRILSNFALRSAHIHLGEAQHPARAEASFRRVVGQGLEVGVGAVEGPDGPGKYSSSVSAVGNPDPRTTIQQYRQAPCSFAILSSRRSRVQSRASSVSAVEASRCASMKPKPRPMSFLRSMSSNTSSFPATAALGSAPSRESTSPRFPMEPQANSPITSGCASTSPALRSTTNSGTPL